MRRASSSERVSGSNAEQITDAACRLAFYEYALEQVRSGSYQEHADGTVSIDLPSLPRNAAQTRETTLYTDARWPCTAEEGGRTLHSSTLCPGATGAAAGWRLSPRWTPPRSRAARSAAWTSATWGGCLRLSTSIANGFEHHWRIIVEASEDYERARNEEAALEARLRGLCRGGRGVLLAGARAAERRAALASALRERGDASPWSHEMP